MGRTTASYSTATSMCLPSNCSSTYDFFKLFLCIQMEKLR
uniref:Uncharacterized protein n=1 Tax=Angiostrongylus cantonensis TaxID=6313 RepID=A0A0K0CUT3_ANGCA